MKKRLFKVIVVLILCFVGITAFYLNDYYKSTQSVKLLIETDEKILIKNDCAYYYPKEASTIGFIFYPGAKVEYDAYSFLMQKLSEEGIFCVVPHMSGNIAILEMNAAEEIIRDNPQIDTWYIGGHSLGGVMAASYLNEHSDQFAGLILLASYSTKDLSDKNIGVLSIVGDKDGVIRTEKMEECKANLPDDTMYFVISGANHAGYASYGDQKGDNEPMISSDEQIDITAQYILQFIK